MARLFIDVDTQFDFCHPEGALFVPGAPAVMPTIQAMIERALTGPLPLVGSVDTHNFTAWEFEANGGPFPPHCVKGTRGWLKMPGTLPERSVFVPDTKATVDIPEGARALYFEKEVYSLFVNPSADAVLDAVLTRANQRPEDTEAVVFGIATDYCVKAAALGLRERGFEVSVVTDAIAAVAEPTGHQAIEEMKAAGCRFVTSGSL